MINITLPDGSRREFEQPVSVGDVAASIGAGLAKAALAGKVDGQLVDLSHRIEQDAELAIVTDKSPEALDVLRHSTAHLLAQAVQRLHPGAQVTIGPVIENGFYYDFAYERPFTPEDLPAIEAEMHKIVKEAHPVARSLMSRNEAVKFFRGMGEEYKAEIIESIPADQDLSLYAQGEFTDLCRGPHVPSTDKLRAFKLMKVAGHLHQLEGAQLVGAGHVRPAAQVGELALRVQGEILVGRDRFDDLGLVFLAHAAEELDRLVAAHQRTRDRMRFLDDLVHLGLDCRQVLRRERPLIGEVVVEAVFDDRADGYLRARMQALHRLRQQVRGGMTQHVERLGRLVGDDGELGVLFDAMREVDQLAVNLAGQRGLGKAGTDRRGDIAHRHGLFEFAA